MAKRLRLTPFWCGNRWCRLPARKGCGRWCEGNWREPWESASSGTSLWHLWSCLFVPAFCLYAHLSQEGWVGLQPWQSASGTCQATVLWAPEGDVPGDVPGDAPGNGRQVRHFGCTPVPTAVAGRNRWCRLPARERLAHARRQLHQPVLGSLQSRIGLWASPLLVDCSLGSQPLERARLTILYMGSQRRRARQR